MIFFFFQFLTLYFARLEANALFFYKTALLKKYDLVQIIDISFYTLLFRE